MENVKGSRSPNVLVTLPVNTPIKAPGSCRTFTISSEKLSPRLVSWTEAEASKQRVTSQETLQPLCSQSLTWEHSN